MNNTCQSSFGCHIVVGNVAPGFHVREVSGRGEGELAHLGSLSSVSIGACWPLFVSCGGWWSIVVGGVVGFGVTWHCNIVVVVGVCSGDCGQLNGACERWWSLVVGVTLRRWLFTMDGGGDTG